MNKRYIGIGSGFAELSPVLHKLMVTTLYGMPGQSEQIQALLNEQGYVSLWQIHDITGQQIAELAALAAEANKMAPDIGYH